MLRHLFGRCLTIGIVIGLSSASVWAASAPEIYHFDMAAQALPEALREYGLIAHQQIMFSEELASGKVAVPLRGDFTAAAGLRELLRGSGLSAEQLPSGVFTLRRASDVPANIRGDSTAGQNLRLAQAKPITLDQDSASGPDSLEEVVVTGTRVRGQGPVGSAVTVVERSDSIAAGISSTEQLLQMVPSLTGLGLSESSRGSQLGSTSTYGAGSFNLRGLGPTATLMLVNGHRVVSSGQFSVAPDPAIVATTALERAEVLADGASAVYGSDAVAGVVNLILRRHVEGLELSGRYGSADSYHDYRLGAIGGLNWEGGQATLAVEGNYHTPLAGDARSYNRMDLTSLGGTDQSVVNCFPGNLNVNGVAYPIPEGAVNSTTWVAGAARKCEPYRYNDIVPSHRRNTATFTFDHRFNDIVDLAADVTGLQREATFHFAYQPSTLTVPSNNPYFTLPAGVGLTDLPLCAGSTTLRCETISYYPGGALGSSTRRYVGRFNTIDAHADLNIKLGSTWRAQLAVTNGVDSSHSDGFNANSAAITQAVQSTSLATAWDPYSNRTAQSVIDKVNDYSSSSRTHTALRVYGLTFDGSLATLPAGPVRAAIGAERRDEDWNNRSRTGASTLAWAYQTYSRGVNSGFGEVTVPLLGGGVGAGQTLEINVASRYEKYSDFGSTSNPKFGINYSPINGLKFRSNYSTAFHAPGVNYLVGTTPIAIYLNTNDPLSNNTTRATLQISGGNPNLKPEESTNLSFGLDLAWPTLPAFTASLTYFSIDFKNLIQQQFNNPDVLNLEAQYGSLITRNPTPEQIAAILAAYPQVGGPPSGAVVAIIDGRPTNSARVRTAGIDFDLKYELPTLLGGSPKLGLSGTYLTKYEQAVTATAPSTDQLDTYGFPVNLKMRGMVGWRVPSGWSVNAFVNYTDSYRDTSQPVGSSSYTIDSWTTVDLALLHEFAGDLGLLGGTKIGLNITNVLDSKPPFVNRGAYLFNAGGWDPQQATALGRELMLSMDKKF